MGVKGDGDDALQNGKEVNLYVERKLVGGTVEWDTGGRKKLFETGLHNDMVGHMWSNGLLNYVSVVTGTEFPDLPYRSAFFDTAHSLPEILGRYPTWIRTSETLAKTSKGQKQLLSFHDNFGTETAIDDWEGCKGINEIIWNVVDKRESLGATIVFEVDGLYDGYEETMALFPDAGVV